MNRASTASHRSARPASIVPATEHQNEKQTLSLIAASVTTLLIATTAFASGAGKPASAHIRHGNLNLSNDAGDARLYARLRSAANPVSEYSTLSNVTNQTCAVRSLNDAVAAIDNLRRTALHVRDGLTGPVAGRGCSPAWAGEARRRMPSRVRCGRGDATRFRGSLRHPLR